MHFLKSVFFNLTLLVLSIACVHEATNSGDQSVKEVMDSVITRLYQEVPSESYGSIDEKFMLNFLTDEEKAVLSTRYQYLKVNVPVRVSLMRSKSQQIIPFWLKNSGFVKTDGVVTNDEYEYEVWQKDIEAGWVNLGINGFDMHRVVYFITVGPVNPTDKLEISDYYPSDYSIEVMHRGAFTYHDWSSLLITEYPEELDGQKLFTTVRGRAREAHVKGAFRETKYPSSLNPDQVLLTWSKDPSKSMDIQWRTSNEVLDGIVKYWVEDQTDTLISEASRFEMEDRMLFNDRYVHRFTSEVADLKSGTTYHYTVGSPTKNSWSNTQSFKTQGRDEDQFSFIWFGDTHRSPVWGDILQKANKSHKDVSFYSIAGDLVSTGLYRNEWDDLFEHSSDVFASKPLMPVPGNHDRQDGLGSWMYYELFSLPKNGPEHVAPESSYAFRYGNALFLMLDATHPIEEQSEWIEKQLANTDATWKFAMFHFPPYNFEEPYPDIQEAWCTIFDRYHVDMVMGGHVHYYMRSRPMNAGKVVDSFEDGTVYAISIGIESNHENIGEEPYAEVRYKEGPFYQFMEIDNNVLTYEVYDAEGKIRDELTITKNQ